MKNNRRFSVCINAFLLFLMAGGAAQAATYYVATNGSNSNQGSETSPFKTIAYAVNQMKAGDTTYVKNGVYSDHVRFSRSGTASAPITLMNAPGHSPTIDCGREGTKMVLIQDAASFRNAIGHITIEGLEIRNCWVGIKMHSGHDITIRRNWIHHIITQGILGNGTNVLIDRNVVSQVGGRCVNGKSHLGRACNQLHALYLTGSNFVITNNLIYDNLAWGVHVAGYGYETGSQYRGPLKGDVPSKAYAEAANFFIANNTIAYNDSRSGLILWQRGTVNAKIINNIFYENNQKGPSSATNGIDFLGAGGGHVIENNICYSTGSRGSVCIAKSGEGKYTGSNNVTVNPNFEGAGPAISGVPNFKLRAGSPAIDKGKSLTQVTWDHAGGKRPFGAAFDIGAYEFGSPPDSGSPPPNPTGGDYGSPGAPVLLGPNGEVCPTGF
jgi:hypothetical protein